MDKTEHGEELAQLRSLVGKLEATVARQSYERPTNNVCFRWQQYGTCTKKECTYLHIGASRNPPRTPQEDPRNAAPDTRRRSFLKVESSSRGYSQRDGNPSKDVPGNIKFCRNMEKFSHCQNRDCRDSHGLSRDDGITCSSFSNNRPCKFLWSKMGCRYSHKPTTSNQSSSPSNQQRQERPMKRTNYSPVRGQGQHRNEARTPDTPWAMSLVPRRR